MDFDARLKSELDALDEAYAEAARFDAEQEAKRQAALPHLDALEIGLCTEDRPCQMCDECNEPGPDPVRDGWVDSRGRP